MSEQEIYRHFIEWLEQQGLPISGVDEMIPMAKAAFTPEEAQRYARSYSPSFFSEIEKIVTELSEEGIEPVPVTLPGLFSVDRQPTEKALRMGHLPGTNNAYVLAFMKDKYNDAIRLLTIRENIPLIDLEEWGNKVLTPPEQWFADSVHLLPEGQVAIGNYIGERLIKLGLVSLAK